ncbi:protein lev-9-like [Centruroides sculpturatus]|uniref:protein lev-9-like n=1 Tax=Centruroides sculpturatus TaxID=218467 RepID=UPI000C6E5624|nr:protein lev-9-like [Centruroides sculpturatus]
MEISKLLPYWIVLFFRFPFVLTDCVLNEDKLFETNEKLECKPVHCEKPHPPENGLLLGDKYTYPNFVKYVCNDGFKLKGLNVRYCMENGKWSGCTPICARITCKMPRHPLNGKAELLNEKRTEGSVLLYYCNSGFNLIGMPISICLKNGEWSSASPICTKPCSVPNVENGKIGMFEQNRFVQITPNSTVEHGEKLMLRCYTKDEFYTRDEPSNDRQVICKFGKFNPLPICPKDTSKINFLRKCTYRSTTYLRAFLNGEKEIEDGFYDHGSRLRFGCPYYSYLKGSVEVKCENGTWLPNLPFCYKPIEDDDVFISFKNTRSFIPFLGNVRMIIDEPEVIRCNTVKRNISPTLTGGVRNHIQDFY